MDASPLRLAEAGPLFAPFRLAGGVLLAVSGGPDSTALMHLAAAVARAEPGIPPLAVATVDHGLRAGSRAEAEAVAAAARALGLPHDILPWEGPSPRTRIQERARAGRYALLAACARRRGATHIVTAHTLDDQAETVLFRMMRGSGVAGLAGMAAAAPRGELVHLRPLLGIGKARLVAACRAGGWIFAEDPGNGDPRFARARLRVLMPALAAEGLDGSRLATLARRMAEVEAALGMAAALALAEASRPDGAHRAAPVLGAPAAVRVRALALLLAGSAAAALRLDGLERLADALADARARRARLRRTLANALVDYDGEDTLRVAPAPPRRRGGGVPLATPDRRSTFTIGAAWPSGRTRLSDPPRPRPDTVTR